jgi:hypothetical protein
MSAAIDLSQWRTALEKTNNDWLLRYWGAEAEKHLKKVAKDLEGFQREYKRRFGETPDILGLAEVNPTKAAAFFHLDTFLASREMKILIWRLLLGAEVEQVDLKYKAGKDLSLRIVLFAPYDIEENEREIYETTNSSDYRILRHFGLAGVEGRFELQGYYALKGEPNTAPRKAP